VTALAVPGAGVGFEVVRDLGIPIQLDEDVVEDMLACAGLGALDITLCAPQCIVYTIVN